MQEVRYVVVVELVDGAFKASDQFQKRQYKKKVERKSIYDRNH